MPRTLVEKIVGRFLASDPHGPVPRCGDYVALRPRHVMTHDNTAAVMKKFTSLGAEAMADPRQPIFTLDHNVQDLSEGNQAKYADIEAFADRMGVEFFPAGRGIGHQIMVEEGFAWPGTLVVASDSHSNLYGGIGALGTPVVRTDAAALWATGETWWQIPPVTQVVLEGALAEGVAGKDIIVSLCGIFAQDEVLNHAVEFTGPGIADLSIESRLSIANMTTEWGALAGVFPVDNRLLNWYRKRVGQYASITQEAVDKLAAEAEQLVADPDAPYFQTIQLDLATVEPCICGPDTVKIMQPVSALAENPIRIDKAYLLSCVNGRLEDFAAAAEVLQGAQVAEHVEFWIAAASDQVQQQAEANGDWQTLLDAGARPLPAGCGPCIGMGAGLLEDGEVGISATNRNFQGRMGSPKAQAYLASPRVVAASAAAGQITGPDGFGGPPLSFRHEVHPAPARKSEPIPIVEGFPALLEGELLFCNADNLNTDAIYAGKYTYREDMTPEQMAAVAMGNYDPDFQGLVREGDILVGGFNFGTGSSREQAATALNFRGIPLVCAGSFSATYKRNAFNNGFSCVDSPALLEWLRQNHASDAPTVRTGYVAQFDFARGEIRVADQSFPFAPLGPAAQELVAAGGLENLVRKRLRAS